MENKRKTHAIFRIILLVALLLSYGQSVHHDFINFDDNTYIYENSKVVAGLTLESMSWAFTATHASNWHPVTWLSHMLDSELFGLEPGAHHLMNVLLHYLNALLLFSLFNKLTKQFWPSCFVCLLFALHPLHVESVAWVSERKDVLSTFFMLITLLAYSKYTQTKMKRIYLLALLYFALGLMSKPMLVTLPLLLLLIDYWPLHRLQKQTQGPFPQQNHIQTIQNLLLEKIPFFFLSGISCIITYVVQHQSGAVKSLHMMPLDLRLGNALVSYIIYLQKTLWPTNLALLYPYPDHISLWLSFAAGAILIGITGSAIIYRKKHPIIFVGWHWYLISLLPVIGLVQVGVQALADRYTYIPLIGIFLMISFSLGSWQKINVRTKQFIGLVVAVSLLALSWKQIGYWKNSETIFRRSLEVTSKNYTAHNYLAKILAQQGKTSAAEVEYKKALAIKPLYSEALVNYGVLLAENGKSKKAYPYLKKARDKDPNNPKINNNIGNVYKSTGYLSEAVLAYKQAITLKPDYKEALFNLANTLEKLGNLEESIQYYQKVITIDPKFPEAYNGLGVAVARSGKINEAKNIFKKALRLRPNYKQAKNNLEYANQQTRP